MHLSYNICTLLLSAYKRKHMTVSTFRICCASIDLKTDGSSRGRDLSNKLQKRLTRWGPLHDCEDAVRMISRFNSFGSGSLLELASLHNVHRDVSISNKDALCDLIVGHLVSGECQNTKTALCASVCSVLLPSTEPRTLTSLVPRVLDAVINMGSKKTPTCAALSRDFSCFRRSYWCSAVSAGPK